MGHSSAFKKYAYLIPVLAAGTVLCFNACSRKISEQEMVLDSAYVEQYMAAHKTFNNERYWAMTFYKDREFRMAWFKEDKLVPQAEKMLGIVGKAYEEGLDPSKYNVVNFDSLFTVLKSAKKNKEKRLAVQKNIDIALSATYFNWAADYYRGLMPRKEMHRADWDVKRNSMRLDLALQGVLGERATDMPYADFQPMHPEYAYLKEALAHYRSIEKEGGWPIIPAQPRLYPGVHADAVRSLCRRLRAWKASAALDEAEKTATFTPSLQAILKEFQRDNGLTASGKIDSQTLQFLNRPVRDRIHQLIINMERWRWIPEKFSNEYLLVNIPEFRLRVFKDKKTQLSMNVIVGKEMHNTPIFNDMMEHVVLAPYWNIPPGILKNEVAPKVAANPGYLESMDMEVIDSSGKPVDPSSINWSEVGSKPFNYTVRRRPGPKNDLGRVKFIFPNSRNIYLHDTPSTQLFSASQRSFSHGCVRVEKPIELAEYILKDAGWSRERIMNQVDKHKELYVKMKHKLPVYLLYFTAAADSSGKVNFFQDIYDHDSKMEQMYFSML